MVNSTTFNENLLSIKEATEWAQRNIDQNISSSNISYLVQYGQLRKYNKNAGVYVHLDEIKKYYQTFRGKREINWKKRLGNDINWHLSFDHLREKDTTKHVHRLHPYKGKFIPQLVEYFIDDHIDEFKKDIFFQKGDIVLDPFSGSGTTLVQANELGIHSVGIDISRFNSMITECKLLQYDLDYIQSRLVNIQQSIEKIESNKHVQEFEYDLLSELYKFNKEYFPTPDFRRQVRNKEINEEQYGAEKADLFLAKYNELVKKYGIELNHQESESFLDKWYVNNVRKEIQYVFDLIKEEPDPKTKRILALILSRTIRSCRATTHSDLATLKEPQLTTYYCHKHKKICKPLFSIKKFFQQYSEDTIKRLRIFQGLRTSSCYSSITADSREVNISARVKKQNKNFGDLLNKKKIKGIFTSPPYVGQIDYHEQHAYAYDLLGFERQDELEIGPLWKGQGREARESYIRGVADVLNNCKQYLVNNYDVFIVANDKYGLYPQIADKAGMQIAQQFKRPVLNRTERDKNPYAESIFHLKEK